MASENPSPIIIDAHLFDEVLLVDKAIGIVKFIGEVKGKNGLFFGVDIKKGKGKNNGCIKNRRYFRTRKDKESGRFTQISKIVKSTKTQKSIPFTVGDSVKCPQLNTTATIRYVGIPAFDKTMKTVYFGIELSDAKGDCDGEIYSAYLGRKISYFKCEANHGLYVKSTEITLNYVSNDKNIDNNVPSNDQLNNNIVYDDQKATDSNKDDEIERLRQEVERLQNVKNETQHEKLLKEYSEYKEEIESEIERQLQETNELLSNKNEEIDELKQELNDNKIQNGYDELLKEFNEYKEKYELIEQNGNEEEKKEDVNELNLKFKKLMDENKKLKVKYNKLTKGHNNGYILSDSGNNLHDYNNSNEYSTDFLEKELEALKMKSKSSNKKQRISGVLTTFAATDAKSAIIILKQILKQWESQFISKNSRIEYLKNFGQILTVIGNSIDMNKKNPELDPIIKSVVNIIQQCRDSNDNSLKNTATELCENDIILQFMMRSR